MSGGVYNRYTGFHNRRSIRLPGYDYSRPGYYFVTVCIHDRTQKLFGDVVDGKMVLNDAGECARQCWLDIPMHFPNIKLDEYIVMPNHIHGVIVICDSTGVDGANDVTNVVTNVGADVGADVVGANNYSPLHSLQHSPQRHSLQHSPHHSSQQKQTHKTAPFCGTSKTIGSIVRGFKIGVTKWFHKMTPGPVIWQRNYYEHIIRDEKSLFLIRKYIQENIKNWDVDSENHLAREIPKFAINKNTGNQVMTD